MKTDLTALTEKKCCLSTFLKGGSPLFRQYDSAVDTFESSAFTVRYSNRIDALSPDWDAAGPNEDLPLSRDYLQALEAAPPTGVAFGYLLFFHRAQAVGRAVVQYVCFDAADQIRSLREQEENGCSEQMKRALAQRLRYRVLVCGNLLFTGEHAYTFDRERIGEATAASLLEDSLARLVQREARSGKAVDAVLVKDIRTLRTELKTHFQSKGYHRLSFQPSMIFDLRPEWRSPADYFDSMTSKYRIRARRAFKKAQGLDRRVLSTREVSALEPRLYALYRTIAERADFNMLTLHPQYFSTLKRALPAQCQVIAYYREERMVGFYSTLRNDARLEAHFLGFEPAANRQYQLYLKMLYDMIGAAIEAGVASIVFARTALEIKSSVGAHPVDMELLLRANQPWFNKFVPSLIRLLEPKAAWTPRHPFK